ncbi:hypothetical protein [Argonema antarcticum]|uniref:hypothetical protein n=1 Tax=Argonema antarcticum TaxID=2942763 RepID=UPI0020138EC1|nr:hypothetical protein [Argonema antarcticum]MCL1475422.1 hypothetical protein [Argonema antarcticum A004/B2]
MKKETKFMRVLAKIQTACGWFLSVSMAILAILLAFSFPVQACFFGLIAIGICQRVDLPDIVRVGVAIVGLIFLSI